LLVLEVEGEAGVAGDRLGGAERQAIALPGGGDMHVGLEAEETPGRGAVLVGDGQLGGPVAADPEGKQVVLLGIEVDAVLVNLMRPRLGRDGLLAVQADGGAGGGGGGGGVSEGSAGGEGEKREGAAEAGEHHGRSEFEFRLGWERVEKFAVPSRTRPARPRIALARSGRERRGGGLRRRRAGGGRCRRTRE